MIELLIILCLLLSAIFAYRTIAGINEPPPYRMPPPPLLHNFDSEGVCTSCPLKHMDKEAWVEKVWKKWMETK